MGINILLTVLIFAVTVYNILLFRKYTIHPGMQWLLSCIIMFFFWAVLVTLMSLAPDKETKFIVTNFFIIVPFCTSVLYFMFCYEFTLQRSAPKVLYTSFPIAILVFILGWFNPYNLVYAVDVYAAESLIPAKPSTIRFFINVIFGYSFVLLGTGMIFTELMKSRDSQRNKQVSIIILCTLLTVILSLPTILSVNINFEPILIAILMVSLLISYSIKNYQFGVILSMASEKVIEESNTGIIVCQNNRDIIKANKKAKSIFNNDIRTGMNINKFIDKNAETLTITVNNQEKHLKIQEYTVGEHKDSGYVYTLTDITKIKKQEKELEIYQDVIDRVLRHNVRNDMNVIEGYTNEIISSGNKKIRNKAEIIDRKCSELHNTIKKLRKIQKVINKKQNIEVDIEEEIKNTINENKQLKKNIHIDFNKKQEQICAISHPCINYAIEEIIENSIQHNNSETKKLRININQDKNKVHIKFKDNGKGIEQHEIDVIESNTETSHKHSSGGGLWLIKWIINRSNGSIEFTNTSNGTEINIFLLRSN